MTTFEENKSEFQKAIKDYYHKNELKLLRIPLLISCGLLFIIDSGFDLNIFIYFGILILVFFITRGIFKRKFINKFFSKVHFCSENELYLSEDQLQIKSTRLSINYKTKECQLSFLGQFLFVIPQPEYTKKSLNLRTIAVRIESNDQKHKYLSIIELHNKKMLQRRILPVLFLTISILLVSLKISETILNKYIYDNKEEWKIARIAIIGDRKEDLKMAQITHGSNLIVACDSNHHYFVEINNKDRFSIESKNSHIYFTYRYEPFKTFRLISYGITGPNPKFLKSKIDLFGIYRFYRNENSLVLLNRKYKIYCIKK